MLKWLLGSKELPDYGQFPQSEKKVESPPHSIVVSSERELKKLCRNLIQATGTGGTNSFFIEAGYFPERKFAWDGEKLEKPHPERLVYYVRVQRSYWDNMLRTKAVVDLEADLRG